MNKIINMHAEGREAPVTRVLLIVFEELPVTKEHLRIKYDIQRDAYGRLNVLGANIFICLCVCTGGRTSYCPARAICRLNRHCSDTSSRRSPYKLYFVLASHYVARLWPLVSMQT